MWDNLLRLFDRVAADRGLAGRCDSETAACDLVMSAAGVECKPPFSAVELPDASIEVDNTRQVSVVARSAIESCTMTL